MFRTTAEAKGEGSDPVNMFKPPIIFNHRRRKRGVGAGLRIILEGGGHHTLCPPLPPNIPPTFSFNVYVKQSKVDHKCINLIYVPFILFEGIS